MRGKVKFKMPLIFIYRITPAYAGKRFRRRFSAGRCEDHPRLCGEKVNFDLVFRRPEGSPPPMRGKEDGREREIIYDRITPAYAGKRSF